MLELAPRSVFTGLLHPLGEQGSPGVRVREERGISLATLFSHGAPIAEAVRAEFGIALPERPAYVANGAVAFIGTGPQQWLALSREGGDWGRRLRSALGNAGSVVEQSDGYGVLSIAGPKARAVFEKGFPIDLHQDAFPVGAAASTLVAGVGVTVWLLEEAPRFEVMVARSLAGSFMHWLAASAGEFGLAVEF
jgi:methylglutamate dehydrogenase subunit D